LAKWRHRQAAGICENDIEVAEAALNIGKKPIDILQIRRITLQSNSVMTDSGSRLINGRFAPSGNDHLGAFSSEELCGGETESAISPGNERYLLVQFWNI